MSEKFRVIIFDEEIDSIRFEKYIGIDKNDLETKNGLYPLDNTKKFYNETDGTIYYFINLDLPSKIEVSNLKQLRRSTALNNIFNYQTKKPFDLIGFMPWIVIIIMAIFM